MHHASTERRYGGGNEGSYGHVKLSNEYATAIGGSLESLGASQYGLYLAYASAAALVGNVEKHFHHTVIVDASAAKEGYNFDLSADNTYMITATKGTHANETAVFIVNTRNNTCVITTLNSVSGITTMNSLLTIGIYADAGIVAELSCTKLSL